MNTVNLTENEKRVLGCFIRFKSFARQSEFNRMLANDWGTTIYGLVETQLFIYDEVIDSLVNRKLLRKNKAGAVSLVPDYSTTVNIISRG